MSEDLKAKFRAAAAQRGLSSAKDQLKAIKAQKAAMAAAAGPGPSSQRLQQQQQQQQQHQQKPVVASGASQPQPSAGSSLPADFFQKPSQLQPSAAADTAGAAVGRGASAAVAAAPGPSSQALAQRPAAASGSGAAAAAAAGAVPAVKATGAAGAGAATSALPQGFFSDKAADAQARGVKLPTAADREAEFRAFTELIDEELKQQAVEEAEAAEEEAEEKADREAFLLGRQQERLELLRRRKALLLAKSTGAGAPGGPSGAGGDAPVPASGVQDTGAGALPELPPDEELRVAPPPAFWSDEEEEREGADEGRPDEGIRAGTGPGGEAAAAAAGRGASPGAAAAATAAVAKRPRRALPVLTGKRRRVIDALAVTLAGSDGEGGSSSGEESDGEGGDGGAGGLNWRAKRV